MSDQLSSDLASLKISRDVSPDRGGLLRTGVIIAVVLGVLAAAYLIGYPYLQSKLFKTEVAVTEMALVSPAQASIQLTSSGYVVPQVVSKVGAKVPGRIARMEVREGHRVKAGDLLFTIEDADARSAIAAARSRVLASRARAQTSRATLIETRQQAERERALAARGVSPAAVAADLEARARSLEAAVKAADAEARAAEAEVDMLEVALANYTIVATIGGVVTTKPAEAGELVGPQSLTPVLELTSFDSLLVECDVPEGKLYLVELGRPAEISLDAFPGKRYRGKTVEVSPRVNRAKATVTVKVQFVDEATGVLPDMAARVSFLAEELDAAAMKEPPKLIVPSAAVADRGGGKVVFVLDEGAVVQTPVTLGPAFGTGFEVVQGPPAGTRLVKNPPADLADGQKIKEKSE